MGARSGHPPYTFHMDHKQMIRIVHKDGETHYVSSKVSEAQLRQRMFEYIREQRDRGRLPGFIEYKWAKIRITHKAP